MLFLSVLFSACVCGAGGQTWHTAELGEGKAQPLGKAWAWTLWKATVPVPAGARGKPGSKFEVACKAVDSSYNQQPENATSVWNLRGILNNSWHRVPCTVAAEEE